MRETGHGGMGVVYEAVQLSLSRRVAVKILPFASLWPETSLKRFRNEVRIAAMLEHRHIVPIYGFGCERGVHFYAMELIDGCSLADVIRWRKKALENHDHLSVDLPPAAPTTESIEQPSATDIQGVTPHVRSSAAISDIPSTDDGLIADITSAALGNDSWYHAAARQVSVGRRLGHRSGPVSHWPAHRSSAGGARSPHLALGQAASADDARLERKFVSLSRLNSSVYMDYAASRLFPTCIARASGGEYRFHNFRFPSSRKAIQTVEEAQTTSIRTTNRLPDSSALLTRPALKEAATDSTSESNADLAFADEAFGWLGDALLNLLAQWCTSWNCLTKPPRHNDTQEDQPTFALSPSLYFFVALCLRG